ncbi:hypothetical protein Sru01_28340 [Sphaerisporangium rufum]|uniref:Uncharacterized protein n=1 Tax=Sphaerisporangium rufum TaxID=1381558 RepID=A0A919R1B4_9ACTN|nr:hypothetical protein [Sphaerisporangium rufum]GII77852.1 hypothetical protein Sru01_28340 [Sphaerisporangium rufum]
MIAAIALLLVMVVTVTMFELAVNNRPRRPKVTVADEPAVPPAPEMPTP